MILHRNLQCTCFYGAHFCTKPSTLSFKNKCDISALASCSSRRILKTFPTGCVPGALQSLNKHLLQMPMALVKICHNMQEQ